MGSSLDSHRKLKNLKIAYQPDEVQEEVQGFWCLWSKVDASVVLSRSRLQVSLLLFKKTDLAVGVAKLNLAEAGCRKLRTCSHHPESSQYRNPST